jgi:hypothetical protein
MKAALGAFLLIVAIARAEPVFVGYLATRAEGMHFAVAPSAQEPARWLNLGESAGGYVLSEFRAVDETLMVSKDGKFFALTLKQAKVLTATTTIPPNPLADAQRRLAEMQERLKKLQDERAKALASRRALDAAAEKQRP